MQVAQRTISLTPRQQRWRAKYGPWAVVTGASDGIGREMALSLAKAGLNVVVVARRRPVLEQLSAELSEQYGVETLVIEADLSRISGVDAVIEAAAALEVGLLVACAGFGTSGKLIESSLEQELAMLDVNCRAVLALSMHFGQRFARQGRGGLVLMSSLLAFQGVPRSANYAATKAYIQSLAEGLHVELALSGVDVIASAPGPIQSGFAARADMQMALAARPVDVAQATLNALGHKTTIRPGWLSKMLEASLVPLPRRLRVGMMGRIMGSMTRHQASKG